MKKWFLGLLAEHEGDKNSSMTRFLSLICVLTAMIIAFIAVIKDRSLDSASILCGTFLGAGLGSKVLQKRIEVSGAKKVETDIETDK